MMSVACEPCRQRKRRCDRATPSCSLCIRTSRHCFYLSNRVVQYRSTTDDQSQESPTKELIVKRHGNAMTQSPRPAECYPIAFRWYMPQLLRHFCEGLGVSRLPVRMNSTAYQLQTIWMASAMTDPCLFHATLFAGSSYFDLARGEGQSPITVFHQSEAIKLINERLSDPILALDDTIFLAISPLTLFAELNRDRKAADIHRHGLQKLATLRGGLDKLGVGGLANTIIYSLAFDAEPDYGFMTQPLPPPLGLEARIFSTAISNQSSSSRITCLLVQDLFCDVHTLKLRYFCRKPTPLSSRSGHNNPCLSDFHSSQSINNSDDPIYHCCVLGVHIFRTILASSPSPLDALVSNLKAFLALTDDEIWLRYLPAAYSWVCLTGAAASDNPSTRLWFYFKQASAVRLLHVQAESSFLVDLWSHFQWLRTLRLSQGQSRLPEPEQTPSGIVVAEV